MSSSDASTLGSRFYIDGEWRQPIGRQTADVLNSTTEQVFATVGMGTQDDVTLVVEAARRAFDEGPWPRLTHVERAKYLRAIGSEIDARRDEFAKTWTIESGVTIGSSEAVAGTLGDAFRYYADLADSFAFEERHVPRGGGASGLLVREAVGVVVAIVPWNSPARLMSYKLAPALLAGCTVILKASPEAPCNLFIMAEICEKVGLPRGVFNVLTADRDVSELLVRHPDVDKITFTGSTAAGRKIGAICGERMARCTLELGGKSPALILDDYDVEAAAKSITGFATYLTGQACSSLTRLLISRDRHDAFVDALASTFGAVTVGDPFDPASQMGPLATAAHLDRVNGYVSIGTAEGAKLVAGGRRPAHLPKGYFIEPTIFANASNDMKIAREEVFGPVLTIIPVDGEEDMIAVANDTPYGLNASVFTNDTQRAYDTARRLRAGTVGHNSWRSDFSIAFGGFKQSGIGREGGVEGLMPFLETKTIVLDKDYPGGP